MGVNTTVVFTDLTGSTSVFESLGNTRATRAVTQLTRWICEMLQARGGQVIKTLGDGVLTVFSDATVAVNAVVELQRQHQMNLLQQPLAEHLPIRVGVASGEVEIVNGDCYGDAVNIASRLSDLAGPMKYGLKAPIWTIPAAPMASVTGRWAPSVCVAGSNPAMCTWSSGMKTSPPTSSPCRATWIP